MFKRLIKNIIPLVLLLHISSCSSFGVSKSEMNGACGIIDNVLNDSEKGINYAEIKKPITDKTEEEIKNILSMPSNQTCLKNLKENIEKWGKRDFIEAINDCFLLYPENKNTYTCDGEHWITGYDGCRFPVYEPTYDFYKYLSPEGKRFSSYDIEDLSKEINFEEYVTLFENLCICINKNPKDKRKYEEQCENAKKNFKENKKIKEAKNILNKYFTEIDKDRLAHPACARLIAIDLDKITNQLSYRIKYLPYIFRSGSSENRKSIYDKTYKSSNDVTKQFINSLRFIEDYGFQDTDFSLRTDNALEGSDKNSHHTDSERALLLCLTEKAPKTIYFNDKYKPTTKEESYKLANFVHENTIDLCIQVRNQNPMCGNCQCFYTGRDKVDLNGRGGIFLERGDQNDLSGASHLNILSILDRMEKRKNEGIIKNHYNNSLFLATRHKGANKYGTKVFIGDQNKDSQFPATVPLGKIVHDTDAKQEYENAKNTYYSRSKDATYINGIEQK